MIIIELIFFIGVCHADDLMYIFNLDIPLVLCNLQEVMRKYKLHFDQTKIQSNFI